MNYIHPYTYVGLQNKVTIKRTSIEKITEVVCLYFYDNKLSYQLLKSSTRRFSVCLARYIVWHIARKHNKEKSLVEIGKYFGRHHTTVINGLQQIENLIATDADVCYQVQAVESLLTLPIETTYSDVTIGRLK